MPRKYVRKAGSRTYCNYSQETIDKAVGEISSGKSIRSTSKKYSIPVGTLHNKVKTRHSKMAGGQNRLSEQCEDALVSTINLLTEWRVPLDTLELRMLVKSYLDKLGVIDKVFKDNMPGLDWMYSFIKRHNLTKRVADNVKRSRAQITPDLLKCYFANLEHELKDIPPTNIFNYDETNITDDPGSKSVVVPRGLRRVERVVEHSKQSTSVMFCGSADGDYLPPMVVYKSENVYEGWISAGPVGAVYDCTKSGWFDARTFNKWFFNVFLPFVSNLNGPVALIGDNLGSHFTSEVIAATLTHNIKFITLLPNSTHLCQPLDIAVFRTLKSNWRNILYDWRKKTRHIGCVPKVEIPKLLSQLVDMLCPDHLKSGFKASGIYPLDSSQVLKRLPGFNNDPGGNNTSNIFNDSVMELLSSHCGIKPPSDKKSRGRKITPGKRVVNLKKKATEIWNCCSCSFPWEEEGDDRWIQCDYCDSWYHLQCATGIKYSAKEYNDLDIEKLDFVCVSCNI